jgi:hypothetical protein
MMDELEARGIRAKATVTCYKYRESKSEIVLWAENRDLSQLALLSDDEYETGLRTLRAHSEEEIRTEYATVDVSATVP